MLLAAVMCLASCQDQQGQYEPQRALGSVRFRIGMDGSESKAVYSGEGTEKLERIDWQAGDALGVYCAAAKEEKYARYVVKSVWPSVGGVSRGVVEADGKELVWGDGPHVFYSYFPEKSEGGIGKGITETETKIEVSASLTDKQKVIGAIDKSSTPWVASPDLKNMLMVSKSATYTPEGGFFDGEVSLNFMPLTTAVQFTITNQTKAEMIVKSVSLTSAASALCGDFTVDVQSTWQTPDPIDIGNETITYSHTYPVCDYSGSVTDATRTVTIEFTEEVTLAYEADPDESGKLTFTFFLQPCQDFDDLTFRITKADNSWMQTRLGYTDGSGILFPRFMKSKVDGIFVPEGAQWTVKYSPDIEPWNVGSVDPKLVEVSLVSPIL